jgi:methylenetetrahydrofolate dehydrogenase (NADP+)/methenyltetrahydrofolate cyclohydrolase
MTARTIDGRALARRIKDEVRREVEALVAIDVPPNLVSLQVGESEPSRAYLESQKKACGEVGILYTHVQLDRNVAPRQLLAHVDGICKNPEVTGLIIQLPVPARLDVKQAYRIMDPEKDVEGMHPANLGAVIGGGAGGSGEGEGGFALLPCTALAVLALVRETGIALRGREAVVIGSSQVVGKPISALLLNEGATVTTCHIDTRDLAFHTRHAEVLVSAVGSPGLIGPGMVREGAVVIDVGLTYVEESDGKGGVARRPVGDVQGAEVGMRASWLTPVPGGVGPVTVAMLLKNTVAATRARARRRGHAA